RRLQTHLARARRRGTSGVFVSEGKYHFVYPPSPLPPELAGSSLVVVHDWPKRPAALQRVFDATAGWDELDWRADPQLEQLIKSLDPEGAEERDLVHAAASALHRRAVRPRADEPADADKALGEILQVGFVPA